MQRCKRICTEEISIHALRGEGDYCLENALKDARDISIHALRGEGDSDVLQLRSADLNFYPRPPRGGRLGAQVRAVVSRAFLSTPSAGRATIMTPS